MQSQTQAVTEPQRYPYTSESFRKTIKETLNQKNQLYSCQETANILKQTYEKVNQKRILQNKLIYNKKQFPPQNFHDEIFKNVELQQSLKNAQMFRLTLQDLQRNYDHHVTIFRQKTTTKDQKTKNIWFLIQSWGNVYTLKNWVYDVDIQLISQNLSEQRFDPITKLRDFLGYYNQQWFYEFYKDKQHEKHSIFPRFQEIFSFDSNKHRVISEVEWYTPVQ